MIPTRFYRMTRDGELSSASTSLDAIDRLQSHHAQTGYVSRFVHVIEVAGVDRPDWTKNDGPFEPGDVIGVVRLVR